MIKVLIKKCVQSINLKKSNIFLGSLNGYKTYGDFRIKDFGVSKKFLEAQNMCDQDGKRILLEPGVM